jgi:putative addiction module component (TIGR02574 family)
MTDAVERLMSQASALSGPERSELAYRLLTSLEPDAGVDDAWREDIHRRVAEIRAGTAVGRPAEDVLSELRERR